MGGGGGGGERNKGVARVVCARMPVQEHAASLKALGAAHGSRRSGETGSGHNKLKQGEFVRKLASLVASNNRL